MFTLPFYARALGMPFKFEPPLDKEPRWGSLCRAINKRNQLMHPKSQEDLVVGDHDLEDALSAASWFIEQLDQLDRIAFERLVRLISDAESGESSGSNLE